MTKEEFVALYEKCQTEQCTTEDLRLLEKYQDDFELEERPWLPEMGDKQQLRNQLLSELRAKLPSPRKEARSLFRKMAFAAAILAFISTGIFFYHRWNGRAVDVKDHFTKVKDEKAPILPGRNKAILIQANGNMIDLDGSGNGHLSKEGGADVTKLANGKLVYNKGAVPEGQNITAYNTIATPRGGQYQLTLADGTSVWLNAASSLKFPTTFSGRERMVELTGEAYFEVAKNRNMPFRVLANGVNVKVLGTHFNVMAYPDENAVQTTLLEGSVRLQKDSAEVMLTPGEQGQIRPGARAFKVREVKVNDVISWKNGLFTFDNENIKTIMRNVSRWYDVDIEYEGQLGKQNFGGSVSKFNDISYLLKTLELTGTVHFKVDGRRITVMP
ncbi:FecR domain-containing protein [Mucilaginibacter sp. Bleaf8]|uniref:FecR family protein n=1 Tax=Mucilaginibacter sp. Bleaf8 TaxID=2834430 RepID=UPI001BCC682B|nr:FecR family protein [Mucilaginibacter sp. Bleaf8]MBS7564713.1 FecR domain-containing protein [Mucilaginibacter sp. Bleaf8]